MKWSCKACGVFDLEVPDGQTIRCPHTAGSHTSQEVESMLNLKSCVFRSSAVGQMECGCAATFNCLRLHKICSDYKPIDEWVHTFDGVRLTADNYQHCGECEYKTVASLIKFHHTDCIQTGEAVRAIPDEPVKTDVVIPFCEVDKHYLIEAVESILAQEHAAPIMHIVADGCEWPDLIDHPSIRRYQASGGQGPYRITNALVDYFETEYLAIQDCDDISTPDRLWRQIQTMRLTDYEMISGAMEQFVADECKDDPKAVALCNGWPKIYTGMCYPDSPKGSAVNSVKTMTVEIFKRLGGFCDWMMSADHEWDNRVSYAGSKIFHSIDTFGRRRLHTRSLSNGVFPIGGMERKRLADLMAVHIKEQLAGIHGSKFGGITVAPKLIRL